MRRVSGGRLGGEARHSVGSRAGRFGVRRRAHLGLLPWAGRCEAAVAANDSRCGAASASAAPPFTWLPQRLRRLLRRVVQHGGLLVRPSAGPPQRHHSARQVPGHGPRAGPLPSLPPAGTCGCFAERLRGDAVLGVPAGHSSPGSFAVNGKPLWLYRLLTRALLTPWPILLHLGWAGHQVLPVQQQLQGTAGNSRHYGAGSFPTNEVVPKHLEAAV